MQWSNPQRVIGPGAQQRPVGARRQPRNRIRASSLAAALWGSSQQHLGWAPPAVASVSRGRRAVTNNSKILIRLGKTSPWTAPESSSFTNEKQLQGVVADSPHWVPGVPEGSLTVREFHTLAGPVDVMIVAPDGSLTAVECKLEANPEKRRTVIGQLIDYTSAVRQEGAERFFEQWESRGGPDLTSALDSEALQELRDRIRSGRIGLCWVADRIDDDLRRLIEYLNEITNDTVAVTALQLAYARHGDVELLIPSTYGGEIAAAKAAHSGRIDNRDWTQYRIIVDGQGSAPMRKRQAVRTMIKALADKGIPFPAIADQLPAYGLRSLEGQMTDEAAVGEAMTKQHGVSEPKRWFIEDPLLAGDKTWVVYRMWALRDTEDALESLQKAFPASGVSFQIAN